MPTVDLQSAMATYLDNADYAADSSGAKARAFATACRQLLLLLPKRQKHGGDEELEIDPTTLRQELVEADGFASACEGTGRTRVQHTSFGGFRR